MSRSNWGCLKASNCSLLAVVEAALLVAVAAVSGFAAFELASLGLVLAAAAPQRKDCQGVLLWNWPVTWGHGAELVMAVFSAV